MNVPMSSCFVVGVLWLTLSLAIVHAKFTIMLSSLFRVYEREWYNAYFAWQIVNNQNWSQTITQVYVSVVCYKTCLFLFHFFVNGVQLLLVMMIVWICFRKQLCSIYVVHRQSVWVFFQRHRCRPMDLCSVMISDGGDGSTATARLHGDP